MSSPATVPDGERRIRNPIDPRNPLAGVYLAATLFELSEGALRFLVPLNLDARGFGPEVVGVVFAAFSVASLFGRAAVGGLFRPDRARALIVLAGIGSSIAYLLTPFVDHVVLLTLLIAVDGLGWGMATTTLLAVMMVSRPDWLKPEVAMGWYVGFQGIAFALATTVGGVLGEAFGVRVAMLLLATVPAVGAILLSIRIPPPARPAPEVSSGTAAQPGSGVRQRIRRRVSGWGLTMAALPVAVWGAAVAALYLNVMNGLLQTLYPLMALALGLSIAEIGTLSSIRSAVSAVARFGSGWIFGRVDAHRLHVPLLVASAGTVALLPSAAAYLLAAPLLALNGVSRGLLRVTTGAAAMRSMEGRDVGLAAAVMTAGLDVGKLLGPLIGGFVAGAVGLPLMFRIVPLAFLALYLALYVAASRRRARGSAAIA